MDDDIRLDKAAFRALASETRVAVLKQLAQRRKTLTELSQALGMAPSTLKEHLDSLKAADLVKLCDDGHKWKYYELTRNGRAVLNPGERKVVVLLAVGLIAALAFGLQLPADFAGRGFAEAASKTAAPAELTLPSAGQLSAPVTVVPVTIPIELALLGLAISLLVALGAASILILRRAKPRP
ncbi:MAG TPA: winged helix-turn-helix domain-containing protein [archaeon]|nr:winged helix-turn-helix domain-containing protein [archaeon]